MPPWYALRSRTALRTIVSKTGRMSLGDDEMTLRISAVAACCSAASASWRLRSCTCPNAAAARFSCARPLAPSLLGALLLTGSFLDFVRTPSLAPQATHRRALEGFACWHRGHFMPKPPNHRIGERSEPWAETNRPRLAWSRTRSDKSRLGRRVSVTSRQACDARHVRLRDSVIRVAGCPRLWLQT